MRDEHVDPLDLVEYARGALRRDRAASIRRHCGRCDDCGAQLAAVLLVREAHGVGPPARADRSRYLAAAAAAATLLVAAIGLWSVLGGNVQVTPQVAAAGGSAGPAPLVAAPELPTSMVIGLEAVLRAIEIESGFALPATATSRGAEVVYAAQRIRRGELAAAERALRPYAGSSDPRVDLLLGISGLLRGDPVAALPPLERGVAWPAAEEASYRLYGRASRLFLAEALLQSDDPGGAEGLLTELASAVDSEGDWIHDAALDLLARVDRATTVR